VLAWRWDCNKNDIKITYALINKKHTIKRREKIVSRPRELNPEYKQPEMVTEPLLQLLMHGASI